MARVLSKVRSFEVSQLSEQVLVGDAFLVEKLIEFIVFMVAHANLYAQ